MLPQIARAEPAYLVPETLYRLCPNGAQLGEAEQAAGEAGAVGDADARALDREVARQYYRCSNQATNEWVRERAWMLYATIMLDVTDITEDNALSILGPIDDEAHMLTEMTHFADVRRDLRPLISHADAALMAVKRYLGIIP